jgi:hypothetical protein
MRIALRHRAPWRGALVLGARRLDGILQQERHRALHLHRALLCGAARRDSPDDDASALCAMPTCAQRCCRAPSLVKHATVRPRRRGSPVRGSRTRSSAAGPWQTDATTAPCAHARASSACTAASSGRSTTAPWPPGTNTMSYGATSTWGPRTRWRVRHVLLMQRRTGGAAAARARTRRRGAPVPRAAVPASSSPPPLRAARRGGARARGGSVSSCDAMGKRARMRAARCAPPRTVRHERLHLLRLCVTLHRVGRCAAAHQQPPAASRAAAWREPRSGAHSMARARRAAWLRPRRSPRRSRRGTARTALQPSSPRARRRRASSQPLSPR